MKIVFKTLNVNGDFHNFSFCKDCHYGKHHQGHFPMSQSRAKKPLELIHSDVWGPAPILSREGFKYYIHFVDDHTRYTWMFPLKSKAEVATVFRSFHKTVERQFDTKLKTIQID